MSDDRRRLRRAAFHEAGHAVARVHVGSASTPVEVRPDGTGESHGTGEHWACRSQGQYAAWDFLLMLLAGGYSEARYTRRSANEIFFGPASGDFERAQLPINWLVERGFSEDPDAAWRRAEADTRAFLRKHWDAVERVAEALLQRGRLEAEEVAALVEA